MKPGSLIVAYLHGGEVSHSFHHSCRNLWTHDLLNHQRLQGFVAQECGAGRITDGRNDAVGKFLAHDAEWLAFVDSDMGFDPDTFDRLIDAADPVERPIVGALAFGQRRGGVGPAGSVRLEQFPTIYRWVDGEGISGCAPMYDYAPDSLVECDATGAACFVVHRDVLLKLAETFPAPRQWFDETLHRGRVFGEDLTFFTRCKELGYPVHVHTGIKTSHYKTGYLTEDTQPALADIPTFVVIPMRDRMDLTRPLLEQLAQQDEYAAILLYDNGSTEQTKAELAALNVPRLEVFDADGQNIHQMWNAGLAEAARRAWPCNVAVLNNDLKIGPNFLSGLAHELRSDPLLAAVSPNYDGRPGDGVQYVTEICADRYDGTGGLAGFAFMLRSDSGYRFPEQLQWWYGDNHMMANIAYAGSKAGIVLGTTVEHIGGGTQTLDTASPEFRAAVEQDRVWFRRWLASLAPGPEPHVFVLWSGSAPAWDRIRADIAERFTVVQQWTGRPEGDFAGWLSAFYGQDAHAKAAQCGDGEYAVVVVHDPDPRHDHRDTTRGRRMVNTTLFDAKQTYRRWAGNPETVHASDTAGEAQANLAALVPAWSTLGEALAAIPCDWVLLREVTEDVDLLVSDLDAAVEALGAVKQQPDPNRVQYAVQIGGEWLPFDLRHVGDGYYDERWQRDMLARRVWRDGAWHPADDDAYWSLLYHAIRHKGRVEPYVQRLDRMRPGSRHTAAELSAWLATSNYDPVRPSDPSVPLVGVVDGVVVSGHGAAARDVRNGWYDTLGYEPHPGTLNLAVSGQVAMPGPGETLRTPDGRTLLLWPARVRGWGCHLMVGGDTPNTVELLAPVRLRDELSLSDGDQVTVEVGDG